MSSEKSKAPDSLGRMSVREPPEEARLRHEANPNAELAAKVPATEVSTPDEASVANEANAANHLSTLNARPFAENVLRGLRKRDCVKDGYIHAVAFDPLPRTAEEREQRGKPAAEEASIYWEDDGGALEALKKDRQNAGYGIARLPQVRIASVHEAEGVEAGDVTCEREAELKIPYHGNLLYRVGLPPNQRRQAQIYLALMSKLAWKPEQK